MGDDAEVECNADHVEASTFFLHFLGTLITEIQAAGPCRVSLRRVLLLSRSSSHRAYRSSICTLGSSRFHSSSGSEAHNVQLRSLSSPYETLTDNVGSDAIITATVDTACPRGCSFSDAVFSRRLFIASNQNRNLGLVLGLDLQIT